MNSDLEGAFSVEQAAEMVGLGRHRFRQLMNEGAFPPPVYCLRSRRPRYTQQQLLCCLEVRDRGIGFNGAAVLLNRPRREPSRSCRLRRSKLRAQQRHAAVPAPQNPSMPKAASLAGDGQEQRLLRQLQRLGISADAARLRAALVHCFPGGAAGVDPGALLTGLVRFLTADAP